MGHDRGRTRYRRTRSLAVAIAVWLVWFGTLVVVRLHAQSGPTAEWRQWGGPNRDFTVDVAGLAESWPATGPPVLWKRPLGVGHSSILVDGGRLFTQYRVGDGQAFISTSRRSRGGTASPWSPEEFIIALDAATGKTVWEFKYASQPMTFMYGAGPHGTPLIVGDRLFATGTNKQLHALDKGTGKLLWARDLVKDFNSPIATRGNVDAGYGCSPIAYRDTIILQVGGPGQAVMAFRQSDGAVVWKSGDFAYADSTALLINIDGQDQVIVFGGQTINGLDPSTGKLLWTHAHDVQGDRNSSTPVLGKDNVLFISSAYDGGSRAFKLTGTGANAKAEELWLSTRLRVWFTNVLWLGDYIYGSSGDFGPSFLTALNMKTGAVVWQTRDFPKTNFLSADGKVIMLTEDGDLILAKLSPEGVTVLSKVALFDSTSWTVPTLVGKTLYARDREKIVALDLGAH